MSVTIETTIPDFNQQMITGIEENLGSIDRKRIMFQCELLKILIFPNIKGFTDSWDASNRFQYGLVEPKNSDFFKYYKAFIAAIDIILGSDEDLDIPETINAIWIIQNEIRIFIQAVRDMNPPPPHKELLLTHIFGFTIKDPTE